MIIVIIHGLSGSGKSFVSKELQKFLEADNIASTIIPLDFFYKIGFLDSFDVPKAFDWDRIKLCIQTLKQNKTFTIHPYDYTKYSYIKNVRIPLKPAPIVILEGIYANYAKFLLLNNPIVIRVTTDSDLCLIRRLQRDKLNRNIPYDKTIKMWKNKVRPGWIRWNRKDLLSEYALSDSVEIRGEKEYEKERDVIFNRIFVS